MILPRAPCDQEYVQENQQSNYHIHYQEYLVKVAIYDLQIRIKLELHEPVEWANLPKHNLENLIELVDIKEYQALRGHVVAATRDQLEGVQFVRVPLLQV